MSQYFSSFTISIFSLLAVAQPHPTAASLLPSSHSRVVENVKYYRLWLVSGALYAVESHQVNVHNSSIVLVVVAPTTSALERVSKPSLSSLHPTDAAVAFHSRALLPFFYHLSGFFAPFASLTKNENVQENNNEVCAGRSGKKKSTRCVALTRDGDSLLHDPLQMCIHCLF